MRDVKAMLLAAGHGNRLRPLTHIWPKCLMPIGERPVLEFWLETLWKCGIYDVLINIHHLPEIVKEFLMRSRFREWVHYVEEPKLLGTAGTLRANMNFFRKSTVLLIHADNWCQCKFMEFLRSHLKRPKGTLMSMMTLRRTR